MLKGDMAMRKLIIPIQFIMIMGCLAFNGYAEQPKERITNSLGMEFVLIKSGKFMMGSIENEPGRYKNERPHTVNLTSPFYMQTTEVTQGQWMKESNCARRNLCRPLPRPKGCRQ